MSKAATNQNKLNKQKIIDRFNKNVRGKTSDTNSANKKHCGKEGHWLELQMGIKPNASNKPDIYGYEMKNETTSKTTFGDWSASYYIYKDDKYDITRDDFFDIFGKPNPKKNNRPSWSGEPCPTIHKWNQFGQKLVVDKENNIIALYNFDEDKRKRKNKIIPKSMQVSNLIIAKWSASKMKEKVESKFNNNGWFKCYKDKEGRYCSIAFADPFNFETWIQDVKTGLVFFDSGMYKTNNRNYSQWRANNKYWEDKIVSRH